MVQSEEMADTSIVDGRCYEQAVAGLAAGFPWHLPDALFREYCIAFRPLLRGPWLQLWIAVRMVRVEETPADDAGDRG